MSALRLARGFTGRPKIIKADGGYHGHADCLLVAAGPGAATLGIPRLGRRPRRPPRADTLVAWRSTTSPPSSGRSPPRRRGRRDHRAGRRQHGPGRAPAPATSRACAPDRQARHRPHLRRGHDRLPRRLRRRPGPVRDHPGPDHDRQGHRRRPARGPPFGGRAEIMQKLAPLGPVYQAGTLSGNPLAMAAGLKAMEILGRPGTYERLEELGRRLGTAWPRPPAPRVPACVNQVARCSPPFFAPGPITDYATAKVADTARFGTFFRNMRIAACSCPLAVRGHVRQPRPYRRRYRRDRHRCTSVPRRLTVENRMREGPRPCSPRAPIAAICRTKRRLRPRIVRP